MMPDGPAIILFSLHMMNCNSGNIVYPRLLESRDENGDIVLNIRKGFTLYLEKSTLLSDTFYLDSSTAAGTHRTILKGKEIEANLYHDKKHQSSLVVTRTVDGIEVRGILNAEFTIAPAYVSERSSSGAIAHNISQNKEMSHLGIPEDDGVTKSGSLECHTARAKREHFPRKFIVELWILTSSEYRAAFNTIDDFLLYIATAFNAVALRFITMTNPKIRFQLNGITVDNDDVLTKDEVCSVHNEGIRRIVRGATCGVDVQDTLNRTTYFINEDIEADIVFLLTRSMID
ncbi:uncharacterized protein LOC119403257 [Rhipicephalus sanguineus]|uniref:uncharacterized protein LOC119403257 n=1 Tax=Rhipicephalus sanguineus TaxID=34632 RepID=UPI0020C2A66F|nr:uncharacterized protein LOC119403257 [Rhipicephalus sanguineus]